MGVPIDASTGDIECVLDARGSLELRVLDGELPIAGAAVRMETTGGVTLSEAQETDEQGRTRFAPFGAGRYRFSCRRADCCPAFVDEELGPEERAVADVQMRRLADLELTVRDGDGLPVSGLDVALRSVEFGADLELWLRGGKIRSSSALATNALGELRVEGLPRGPYIWSVGGGSGPTGSFELASGRLNELSIFTVE